MQRSSTRPKSTAWSFPYNLDELCAAVVDVIEANGVAPCYIRPIALRGYGEIGVSPKGSPIEVYIANFPWGKYIAATAARMSASQVGTAWLPTPCPPWPRPAPTT
jgi:branched-chain amino acid aminotransferase